MGIRTPLSKIPLLGPLLFCESFAINKEIIKKIKQTRYSRYIYQNELDRACFQHDLVYGDAKSLNKRTITDKYCVINHLVVLKIQNLMDANVD